MKSVIIRDIRNGEIIAHVKRTKQGAESRVLKSLAGLLEIKVITEKGETIRIRP
jgi:hypothetical protein